MAIGLVPPVLMIACIAKGLIGGKWGINGALHGNRAALTNPNECLHYQELHRLGRVSVKGGDWVASACPDDCLCIYGPILYR